MSFATIDTRSSRPRSVRLTRAAFGTALVTALALVAVGCSDDTSGPGGTGGGGAGGAGGEGGAGGILGGGTITIVHLAPGVPSVDDTSATVYVDGRATDTVISYGETTGRVEYPSGIYQFGIGTADAQLVELGSPFVREGDDLLIVAYRNDSLTPPIDSFVYNLVANDLDPADGRVVLGAGAETLSPVTWLNVNDCPPPLVQGLPFSESTQLDLPGMFYNMGMEFGSEFNCFPPELLFNVAPRTGVTTVLVLVDEDVSGSDPVPQVWLVEDAGTPVELIPSR
ncbi:MAG: hypothetical protein AAF997_01790 [Myxococcota bacterium]